MFRLVENRDEKILAQETLVNHLRSVWTEQENRLIMWRPNSQMLDIFHNGSFWFATVAPIVNDKTPRYWNSIGKYQAHGGLPIAVQINIPVQSNPLSVSGFFARDEQTDMVYLFHDGAVGGGRAGIGRESFFGKSSPKIIQVQDSQGRVRHGILITSIEDRDIGTKIARFAQQVIDFKQDVANGEIGNASAQAEKQIYEDYFREFSGKKKSQRIQEVEYITRHGDIVDALSEWRKRYISPQHGTSERIVKNAFIDLGIADAQNNLTELYEVKTNAERQSLYTAIGQIMVHGNATFKNLQRFIVLPYGNKIPHDVEGALERLKIKILRFEMTQDRVNIIE